jgi:hypothetical protein
MLLATQIEEAETTCNPGDKNSDLAPVCYKGWTISTKVINGKLWLHWKHPQESLPRYGCPVSEEGLAATTNHVRFMIDLMMNLELEVQKHSKLQQW